MVALPPDCLVGFFMIGVMRVTILASSINEVTSPPSIPASRAAFWISPLRIART